MLAQKRFLRRGFYYLWTLTQNAKFGERKQTFTPVFLGKATSKLEMMEWLPDGGIIPEECNENFGMSEHSFYILWGELRPYIEKQSKCFNKPIFVEKQGAESAEGLPKQF